jgi:hypothetical protein
MLNPLIFLLIGIPIAISLLFYAALRIFAPNSEFKITLPELGVQALVGTLCIALVWCVGNASAHYDTEVLNGAVVAKKPWTFSCPINTSNPCRNGYDCNCVQVPYDCSTTTTDSKGNSVTVPQTCYRTECDTCYKYDWERNWYIYTNLPGDKSYEIDRIDAQGADEPSRWTKTRIGDGASITHRYKNWVRASADSLFHADKEKAERYAPIIAEYPTEIYDYYKVDRVAAANFKFANEYAWNEEIGRTLAVVGPKRQMNLVVVIVNNVGRDYAPAVRRNWQGFKKNDAILFIGLHNGTIDWAESMSWSKNALFDVQMRNLVIDYEGKNINSVDPVEFFGKVRTISETQYVRRPMKEFEYLKGNIPPPKGLVITAVILGILLGIGTSYLFYRIDLMALFTGRYSSSPRYRY